MILLLSILLAIAGLAFITMAAAKPHPGYRIETRQDRATAA